MQDVWDLIQNFDDGILLRLSQIRTEPLTQVMTDITALGSFSVLILMGVVVAITLSLHRDRAGLVQLALAGAGAALWPSLLKALFLRERPTIVEQLVTASGLSFPSGHSFGSAAMYLTFALLAGRALKRADQRKYFVILASTVIVLVGFSRTYLGVHYATDVLAGLVCGATWAMLIDRWTRRRWG